jgi:hypothetical protein
MINLLNKDREIFDLANRVADIIKEYQSTGAATIYVNNEGLCLRAAKFYPLLDHVCETFSIDKQLVTIVTNNVEEAHSDYKIIIQGDHWIANCKSIFDYQLQLKKVTHQIGAFFGKPNWHRLVLAAWLHKHYADSTLMTMHYDPESERHRIDAGFSDINVIAGPELTDVIAFIQYCPITLDEGFLNYTIGPPTHYHIIHQYYKIFVDLVSETYVSGLTFFPTEKTLRPIIASTPFVIMGPQGYLNNLKRIGFKTFDRWWDESYDNYSDYERVKAIQQTLNTIHNLDPILILLEMQEVLTHNRQHLQHLNKDSVKLNG